MDPVVSPTQAASGSEPLGLSRKEKTWWLTSLVPSVVRIRGTQSTNGGSCVRYVSTHTIVNAERRSRFRMILSASWQNRQSAL